MTTAIDPSTAPAQAASPAEPTHLSALLYGSEPTAPATPTEDVPAQTPDTDTSLTLETAPATPPVDAKPETPQPGPEAKEKADKEESQRAAAARLGREVQEIKGKFDALAEENKILKAKLDGTYEEPVEPTAQQIAHKAEFEGRERASRAIAEEAYGAEAVQAKIYDKDSPFQVLVKARPEVQIEIMRAPQPAVAAMRVLERQAFIDKYGENPTQWEEKIIAAAKPRLLDEFKKQITTTPLGGRVTSVTDARTTSPKQEGRDKSLASLLYGGSV